MVFFPTQYSAPTILSEGEQQPYPIKGASVSWLCFLYPNTGQEIWYRSSNTADGTPLGWHGLHWNEPPEKPPENLSIQLLLLKGNM